ncbi:hypothetical protein CGRA01v4_14643 [Colletotrichum graminicola]|uniref:Uncharacterized protein n=1 Tax=Colletotrichum graminicola (strain M1.001 / M2 / FGSC 10212) TaxID=645133 RepID=E3Q4Z6_COLGM|nr:uncharacterized protein GLRG_01305 [Colletotrichum graminicola M1.001]EFQ26161.1 hypothetical protein GLRG_01305 [Colletotrichum graminicola M1.001]WDK23351.1 hypothetical protein CGRA01v4_14643 [Colletotrichum graminicola]
MAELFLKPLQAQRRGPDMTSVQPDEYSLAHLDVLPFRSRQRRAVPRIASLDALSASKISGNACPSIRSDISQSSSHQMSPSPVEPNEIIWYRDQTQTEAPMSLDQMVDALHYIMMTKPVLDPVPREYNSYILHLLEGYWSVQEQLKKTKQALAEELETKQRSLEEFTKMSDEWQEKEADFRSEIKRMELVLAKIAPEGVGAVVMARSQSIVDRSAKSSKIFKAKIDKARSSPDRDVYGAFNLDSMETPRIPKVLENPHQTHRTLLSMQPKLDDNADVELSQELVKAQRKRQRVIKHTRQDMPVNPVDIVRTLDTSSSDEDTTLKPLQRTSESSTRPRTNQMSRQSSCIRRSEASYVSKFAISTPQEHDSLSQLPDNALGRTPSLSPAERGEAVTNIMAGGGSDRARPHVVTTVSNNQTEPFDRGPSGIHRHKRVFSFDPGDDDIPRQTCEAGAGAGSANGQRSYMHMAKSANIDQDHVLGRTVPSSSNSPDTQI